MRRGRYEQALRDARSALSYVPSSSEWELFDADAAVPLRSLHELDNHVPIAITETARRAAAARAMHAAALEAAGAVANAGELDVYHPEFNPCALDGDVDADDPTRKCPYRQILRRRHQIFLEEQHHDDGRRQRGRQRAADQRRSHGRQAHAPHDARGRPGGAIARGRRRPDGGLSRGFR